MHSSKKISAVPSINEKKFQNGQKVGKFDSMSTRSAEVLENAEDRPLVLEEQKQAKFELGLCMAIHNWNVLQVAVENQWGGAESEDKRGFMVSAIAELFEDSYVDVDWIDGRLRQMMDSEFGAIVEDETGLDVAKQIIELYRQCEGGDFSGVEKIYSAYQEKEEKRRAGLLPATKVVVEESDEEGDDEEDAPELVDVEMVDHPAQPSENTPRGPIVDDDGFTVVQKKKR